MESVTLFAQPTATQETVIDRVRRDLLAEGTGRDTPAPVLAEAAETSVRALWDSRVKLFVPVLALRDARSKLGSQAVPPERATANRSAPVTVTTGQADVLDLTDDALNVTGDTLDLSSDMRL